MDNRPMPPFDQETIRFIEAWMQVRQIVQASNFNRFQRAGLSATQFMTLNVVPGSGMTLSELARRLNLSPATLNATVNSLEERGFVCRTPDRTDARKVIISATKQGEEMQNTVSHDLHEFMAGIFTRMAKTRRQGLLAGLEEMVRLSQLSRETVISTRRDAAVAPAKHSSRRSPPR